MKTKKANKVISNKKTITKKIIKSRTNKKGETEFYTEEKKYSPLQYKKIQEKAEKAARDSEIAGYVEAFYIQKANHLDRDVMNDVFDI